jgi:hypothetical protein
MAVHGKVVVAHGAVEAVVVHGAVVVAVLVVAVRQVHGEDLYNWY